MSKQSTIVSDHGYFIPGTLLNRILEALYNNEFDYDDAGECYNNIEIQTIVAELEKLIKSDSRRDC